MDAKSPSETSTVLAHWMGVSDANSLGTIHGGTVMKLVDEAAGIAALRHARRPVVTVGVDRMTFLVPIHVAELVTFSATVNAAWRTSMEVGVRVEAENPGSGEVRHTSTAYVTMVALGDDGRPVAIPPLVAKTAAEQRRMREAELRRVNRLAERAEIARARAAE
jgi:acyl-CoA hydrolase